jgi:hypothetical protein
MQSVAHGPRISNKLAKQVFLQLSTEQELLSIMNLSERSNSQAPVLRT